MTLTELRALHGEESRIRHEVLDPWADYGRIAARAMRVGVERRKLLQRAARDLGVAWALGTHPRAPYRAGRVNTSGHHRLDGETVVLGSAP